LSETLPLVLIPGLLASARLYAPQIPKLWLSGPVMIADHTRDDSMGAIARRILGAAPPRFALAGLSMGGYISFEIVRQAPARVVKLALLDTAARPDTPEATQARRAQVAQAMTGKLDEVADAQFARMVPEARQTDTLLRETNRQMAREVGVAAFARQQTAIMGRADSRPTLKDIRCPTLVLVGENDALTPPDRAAEMAEGIAGAKLVTVPKCGHLSTLEQPEAVTRSLIEWLHS
jgi:pimeloyl-ACP methyl ester carboxylesterase